MQEPTWAQSERLRPVILERPALPFTHGALDNCPPPQNPPTVAAVCHEMSPPTCSSIPKIWCWARLDLVFVRLDFQLSEVEFLVG